MPSTMQQYDGYFISPHPDDIAFSCYATLRNPLTSHLRFLIITVFDQSQFTFDTELSGADRVTEVRKDEDQAFAKANNCDLISLGLPDSSVRYQQQAIEYKLSAAEDPIFDIVKVELGRLLDRAFCAGIPIYVPLGNSLHLDHIIVRDVVRNIAAEEYSRIQTGPRLFYYEDLPYAGRWSETQLVEYARETLGPNCAHLHMDLNRIWVDKLRGCKNYASQIEDETIPTINNHALRLMGGEGRAERLWYQPVAETVPQDYAVDTICWVAWESCRIIGGGGVALSNIIGSIEYKKAVRRTILIGPMYMPRDCIEYNPEEDVEEIATKLKAKILYHPLGRGCHHGISQETYNMLREIEFRHGVELVYMRDTSVDEHIVERLLFNLSANILPKRVYSPSLRTFTNELRDQFDLHLRMELIRTRSPQESAFLAIDSLKGQHPLDNVEYNGRAKQAIDADDGAYGHIDNDYIHGMMLAQPASEAMRAVLSSPRETCLLIVQEYLSLPTAYATMLAGCPDTIKTMFYAGEVRTICSLVEGIIEPAPVLSSPVDGGPLWDGPVRALINYINNRNEKTKQDRILPEAPREAFLDMEPLLPIQTHNDIKILQHGWKVDKVLPVSANVRDDLQFLDRGFNFPDTAVHPDENLFCHGIVPIRNTMQRRVQKRTRLLAYAKRCWDTMLEPGDEASWIILTRVARPVAAKAIYRDIDVVTRLATMLPERKALLIIVTYWKGRHYAHIIQQLLSKAKKANEEHTNLVIHIVNSFGWPKVPEAGDPNTHLTREDIHCAADVNLCLSSYDSYNLAALEGLSCGSLCVISASCGAARRVQSLDAQIDKNILVVDYTAEIQQRVEDSVAAGVEHQRIVEGLFLTNDREDIEARVAEVTARGIVARLPGSVDEQRSRIEEGWELAKLMTWDAEIEKSFIPVVRDMFAK